MKVLMESKTVYKTFKSMGFKLLGFNHKNTNGPDLFITKNKKAFSVEIKKAKSTLSGSLQVFPVEPNRKSDDLIAIELPSGYVLIEPMKDHLKLCSKKGYRTLNLLR